MATQRDHYQVLGVERTADGAEIRRAHRRLAHVLHPDRHLEATPAERKLADRRMREINEAWNVLRDPQRRASYDRTLGDAPPTAERAGASSPDGPAARPSPGPKGRRSASAWTGPGDSASAGRGAYWSARPTAGAGARTGAGSRRPPRPAADDGVAVAPSTAFILRKGPIVAIVVVIVGLFVVTAYVGGGGGGEPVTQLPPGEVCARVIEGSAAILVPCSSPNDGEVLAKVDAALDCPDTAPRYVTVGTEFFCIPSADDESDSERESGAGSG
ncbi:MAG: J domain-containing protein [Microthrixaceae bacterium]|nr:J domain-containing protein [Microthrixaceae bacterium]